MNTVVVAGASGFVGRHLAKVLTRNGYEVVSVSRSAIKQSVHIKDVKTWAQLNAEGLPPCEAVINLCGENIMLPKRWTPEYKAEIVSSRTASTNPHPKTTFASAACAVLRRMLRNLILAAKTKPKAFVVASGVGYYTPSLTAEYDESSPGGTSDFFAKLTTAWEDAAQLPKDSGVRVANIRTGAVLGRDGGVFKSMYLPFLLGLGGPSGSGKQPFPWIHIDDLAHIYKHVMENDKCTGIYNGVGPQIVTNKDFVKALGKAMHRPTFFGQPEFVLNFLLNPERAVILTQGQKVHPRRTEDSGFGFLFPTIGEACEDLCMKAEEMPERAA